jgi:hypothetical protein
MSWRILVINDDQSILDLFPLIFSSFHLQETMNSSHIFRKVPLKMISNTFLAHL